MDKSELNIKMLEKAVEIQASAPKNSFGCYSLNGEYEINRDAAGHLWVDAPEGIVWLPTQGDLQGMSGLDWWVFDEYCIATDNRCGVYAETKEQAGIQVVMKEKYKKIWSGEDWIDSS